MIISSPFLICSFLHGSRLLASSIIARSVGSSKQLNILVVYPSRRWSLTQYMSDRSRFFCTLVTTNLPFARVFLSYPQHDAWIPSAFSSLRCPNPSGSANMYSWVPFLAPCVLMPNSLMISSVIHLISGAYFFKAGKLLGLVNCVNIVFAII